MCSLCWNLCVCALEGQRRAARDPLGLGDRWLGTPDVGAGKWTTVLKHTMGFLLLNFFPVQIHNIYTIFFILLLVKSIKVELMGMELFLIVSLSDLRINFLSKVRCWGWGWQDVQ